MAHTIRVDDEDWWQLYKLKLAIINKMLWSQVVQRLVHQQDSELELYSLTNWQPVELS